MLLCVQLSVSLCLLFCAPTVNLKINCSCLRQVETAVKLALISAGETILPTSIFSPKHLVRSVNLYELCTLTPEH